MTGIREDKRRQGRRKSKPSPFGMRELLTLTAASESAALGAGHIVTGLSS